MIASAHFAAGVVIGLASAHVVRSRSAGAAVAFGTAAVVHFLMDAVPHSDYGSLARSNLPFMVGGEAILVGAIAAILLRRRLTLHWRSCVAAGLFGSVLPDAKFVAPFVLSEHNAALVEYYGNRLHDPFHAGATSTLLGMTAQVLCTLILLASLRMFPSARASGSP